MRTAPYAGDTNVKRLIAISGVVIFIYGMLASMLGTILPSLQSRLDLSTLSLSYLALAQGIGLAATSVWAGALMDRYGCKSGIAAGLVSSIAGLALLSHAPSLPAALSAMILLGIGGSLVIVGANAMVSAVSHDDRGAALNILNLFVGLGGMATPFVAANLLGEDVGRLTYCGIAIAFAALVLILSASTPAGTVKAGTARGRPVLGDPSLYILSAITFLYTACEFAIWNWLPKLLTTSGMAAATALNILSLGFAGGMLGGRLLAAHVLQRQSAWAVTLACSILMGVVTLVILHIQSATAVAVLVFVAGLCMAPIFPTTIAIVGRLFEERAGTAIGFAITCGFSGLVISSPLIGFLADPSRAGMSGALHLIPICAAIIAVILIVFRRALADPAASIN
jgi:fucose permease